MNISGEKLFEFDKKYNIGTQICTNEILQSVNNKTLNQEVDE